VTRPFPASSVFVSSFTCYCLQSAFRTQHNIYLIPCTDSDIIHVNALRTSIFILNSYKVAADLLDKRSGIYSSR
jgi:hypothetical protein